MSALRQKMIEDMQIRNYSPHTIEAYVRCVAHFAGHFGKSPDLLTLAHIREYQLFLVQQREDSWATLVQTVCALRFFYQQTLRRKWMIDFIPYPKRVKKLPLILSQEEVHALIKATTNLKHHTILATIYATGLRVSEAAALLVSDIHSGRQMIAVRQGKGRKDRFVMLSPKLLELLRKYWKAYKPHPYLFIGDRPGYPISRDGIGWICHRAAVAARLSKPVTPHTLRHYVSCRTMSRKTCPESRDLLQERLWLGRAFNFTRHSLNPFGASMRVDVPGIGWAVPITCIARISGLIGD